MQRAVKWVTTVTFAVWQHMDIEESRLTLSSKNVQFYLSDGVFKGSCRVNWSTKEGKDLRNDWFDILIWLLNLVNDLTVNCWMHACRAFKLPKIFAGAPLNFNGCPGNIQGILDSKWHRRDPSAIDVNDTVGLVFFSHFFAIRQSSSMLCHCAWWVTLGQLSKMLAW